MIDKNAAKTQLTNLAWEDGTRYKIIEGPYRHVIEILCSPLGRQKAIFGDGREHNYFAYVRVGGNGIGAHVVPVLPNGNVLMVVEQRPPQESPKSRPWPVVGGRSVNLLQYGPYSSLEFPGGGINPGESITMESLREMFEETGAAQQEIELYRTVLPHYVFGSDTTTRNFHAVAFLSEFFYETTVSNDGGLNVLELSPREVTFNIQNGSLMSAHSALMPWFFYEKVFLMRQELGADWKSLITREKVKLAF